DNKIMDKRLKIIKDKSITKSSIDEVQDSKLKILKIMRNMLIVNKRGVKACDGKKLLNKRL
uniref:Uncharacterized protein n=1 Tax=Amphimedon queenslandica TaxID=400682 RepID=A0A1X7VYX9_AMPQE